MSATNDRTYRELALARIEAALPRMHNPQVQAVPAARRMLGWAICSWLDDLGPIGSPDWKRGASLIQRAAAEAARR